MAYQHYRSPFGDTTYTKVFVGGLAWETQTDVMRRYFEQFGEILEAVIIKDKNTGKSKGYGFVTFRDPESARWACADPNPVIDGRRANCNIASLGRPRPSAPRGRNQVGGPLYQAAAQVGLSSHSGVPTPMPPPPPPIPAAPLIYQPYGYAAYPPEYGFPQSIYNPQLQQPQLYRELYGASSSTMNSPYYHGYTMQASRGTFPAPQAQCIQGLSYPYYSMQMEGSFPTFPSPSPTLLQPPSGHLFPSSADSQTPQHPSTETDDGAATSEGQNPKT